MAWIEYEDKMDWRVVWADGNLPSISQLLGKKRRFLTDESQRTYSSDHRGAFSTTGARSKTLWQDVTFFDLMNRFLSHYRTTTEKALMDADRQVSSPTLDLYLFKPSADHADLPDSLEAEVAAENDNPSYRVTVYVYDSLRYPDGSSQLQDYLCNWAGFDVKSETSYRDYQRFSQDVRAFIGDFATPYHSPHEIIRRRVQASGFGGVLQGGWTTTQCPDAPLPPR